jgi:uncharacterized protein (DUF1800 family)
MALSQTEPEQTLRHETPPAPSTTLQENDNNSDSAALGVGFLSAALLSACGGNGNSAGSPAVVSADLARSQKAAVVAPLSANDASRFLSQAAFGGNDTDIAAVQSQGAAAWLQNQFSVATDQPNWAWMMSQGFNSVADVETTDGIDNSLWRKLMASPDTVRQRISLALSEIFVVSLEDLPMPWRNFAAAAYMDLLAANAFGNFRSLLQAVTLSPAMGVYLGTKGNEKEDPATGREADENYAREVMQLFTIGLNMLNNDGSVASGAGGKPIPTFTPTMVTQLAQVFTGWNFANSAAAVPTSLQAPMVLNASLHSTSAKSFLGATIAAGTDGNAALKIALDTLFNHPNLPPFFGRQLIQRLVSSNPSPAYISRVAAAFISGNGGLRGDMKSVISAVLTDPEAQTPITGLSNSAGKLREPVIRLAQWARTFKAVSASGKWAVGDTTNPSLKLGQSPLRSPTVFNFFSPGFVPPNNVLGNPALVAPELQITTEATVIGYANFLQTVINGQLADLTPDYSIETAMASNPANLFNRLNTLLAGGQLSSATATLIQNAINTIPITSTNGALNRVKAAIMMIMCAPEYIVQK